MNIFEGTLRRIDATQQRHTATAFVFGVIKKYGDDNAGALTVQITYSMFVAVFPLLLLLLTVLSIVLAGDPAERQRVLNSAFGQFPIVGQTLAHNLHAMKRSSIIGLAVGLVGLAYGGTGLAQAGLYSMAQIWNIPSAVRPNYVSRMIRSLLFLVVLAVGLVLTTALAGFGTFGRHDIWLGSLGELGALIVNIGLYLAAFRTLTPRQVKSRSLVPGALVGAFAWTILQAVGGYVVGHDLKNASAVYGVFGLVLGLVAWIYLGAEVSLYGAEINSVLSHRLWPRSLVQPPLTDADQRALALQATQNQRRPEQVVSTHFLRPPMSQDEYRSRGYHEDESEPVAGSAPLAETPPGEVAAPAGEP